MFQGGFRWRSRDQRRSQGRRGAGDLIAFVLIAVAWMLSIVIRFSLSRKREYLADAGSVELTKNPDAMISALRKIEGRGELPGATSAVMEMCIDNPREGFSDVFDTHPPIDAPGGGAGEVRRRARSGPAGATRARTKPIRAARAKTATSPPAAVHGSRKRGTQAAAASRSCGAPADRARLAPGRGERARPVGTASQIADVENEARFASAVLRRCQKRLLGGIGTGRRAFNPPAAPLPPSKPAIACTS